MTTLIVFVVVVWVLWRIGKRMFAVQPMSEKERDIGQAVPPSGRPHTGSGTGYRIPGLNESGSDGDDWVNPQTPKRKSKWER